MGETLKDSAEMLRTLANLPKHPESVPLNQLIKIPGTPLENKKDLDPFDLNKNNFCCKNNDAKVIYKTISWKN